MSIFKFCAVCDDVRVEFGGNKSVIIGFFGMVPYVDVLVSNPSQPIEKLTFLFMSGTPIIAGHYRIQVSVKDPAGRELANQSVPAIDQDMIAGPFNAILAVQSLRLTGIGKYHVTAIVNDHEDFAGDFVVGLLPPVQ
jgi:hypothetical protein